MNLDEKIISAIEKTLSDDLEKDDLIDDLRYLNDELNDGLKQSEADNEPVEVFINSLNNFLICLLDLREHLDKHRKFPLEFSSKEVDVLSKVESKIVECIGNVITYKYTNIEQDAKDDLINEQYKEMSVSEEKRLRELCVEIGKLMKEYSYKTLMLYNTKEKIQLYTQYYFDGEY